MSRNESTVLDQKGIKNLSYMFSMRFNGLKMRTVDYILILFGGEKKKCLQRGVDKIKMRMDTLFLIKKMMEIDNLKMLLLTPDQLKLFNYLPKPKIKVLNENRIFRKIV
jgi:hypothetical protein